MKGTFKPDDQNREQHVVYFRCGVRDKELRRAGQKPCGVRALWSQERGSVYQKFLHNHAVPSQSNAENGPSTQNDQLIRERLETFRNAAKNVGVVFKKKKKSIVIENDNDDNIDEYVVPLPPITRKKRLSKKVRTYVSKKQFYAKPRKFFERRFSAAKESSFSQKKKFF